MTLRNLPLVGLFLFTVVFAITSLWPHVYAHLRPAPDVDDLYMFENNTPFSHERQYARVIQVKQGWVRFSRMDEDDVQRGDYAEYRPFCMDAMEQGSFFYCYPTFIRNDQGTLP